MVRCNYILVPIPEIVDFPKNISVLPGSSANFYCLALSYGSLVYDWKKPDGSSLPSTAVKSFVYRKFIDENTAFYSLTISNTQTIHEGEYCCIAQNQYGNTTECAWLNVNSKSICDLRNIGKLNQIVHQVKSN